MRYALVAILSLFVSCRAPRLSATTMEGIAANAKAGAVIKVSAAGDYILYYIDGLSHWPEDQLGRTVRVSGQLEEKFLKPIMESEEQSQTIVGTMRIIRKPKWQIIR